MRFKNLFRLFTLVYLCTAILFLVPSAALAEEKEVVVKEQEVPHESGVYYTIQQGDTLWDLSERFFDSPALWPGLWKGNHQIPNPHWIYPGERIRLYYQSGTQPIKLIKKVEVKPTPPKEEKQESQPEPFKEPPYYYYSPIESIGFIRKVPVSPEGAIFRARDNKIMIGPGDIVYVKPHKHKTLTWGKTYFVYRILESARTQQFREYIDQYGKQHYLIGVVKIMETESDYVVARVIRAYRDMRVNDLLMPFKPRSPKIYLKKSKEDISGTIITSEDRDRMFGDHVIAFIDKGSKDGIETGQFYSAYYRESHGFKFSEQKKELLTPIDFGTVLVLHTEDENSTVLVTYSEKDMYPTATIRTPAK